MNSFIEKWRLFFYINLIALVLISISMLFYTIYYQIDRIENLQKENIIIIEEINTLYYEMNELRLNGKITKDDMYIYFGDFLREFPKREVKN